MTVDVEQQATADARRAASSAVPLLVLAVPLVHYILGSAANARPVHAAMAFQVLAIFFRWAALRGLGANALRLTPRSRDLAVHASAWATSAGAAAIILAADGLSSVQLLELTLVSTAASAIAMHSMTPNLRVYAGYVLIQFSSLVYVAVAHAPSLVPVYPIMIGVFMLALGVSAVRAHKGLRERARLTRELDEASSKDALTGLHNRRYATSFADKKAAREARGALAFLLVDLDHFKAVNDTHGHAAGDAVLAAFAALARKALRAEDMLARWGGEEFLVILDVPGSSEAEAIAERLRAALARNPIRVGPELSISVTCSIGVAVLPAEGGGGDWQSWVGRADERLYRAKHGGRNRVCGETLDVALEMEAEAA